MYLFTVKLLVCIAKIATFHFQFNTQLTSNYDLSLPMQQTQRLLVHKLINISPTFYKPSSAIQHISYRYDSREDWALQTRYAL